MQLELSLVSLILAMFIIFLEKASLLSSFSFPILNISSSLMTSHIPSEPIITNKSSCSIFLVKKSGADITPYFFYSLYLLKFLLILISQKFFLGKQFHLYLLFFELQKGLHICELL